MKRNRLTLEVQFADLYANDTNIGHFILVSGDLSNQNFTTDFSADPLLLTLAISSVYGDGARLRFSSSTALPAPLVSGVDYWLSVISGSDIKVYTSYDNYVTDTPVTLTSNGTGTHLAIEQSFNETDFLRGFIPFSAIANKEITHSDYAREIYNFPDHLWDSSALEAYGEASVTYTRTGANPAIEFQFACLGIGTNNSVGDSSVGILNSLHDFVSPQSISTAQAIVLRLAQKG